MGVETIPITLQVIHMATLAFFTVRKAKDGTFKENWRNYSYIDILKSRIFKIIFILRQNL